jgi:prolyl 4-hydroxylase
MKIEHPLAGVRRAPFVAFVEEAVPAAQCDALIARIEAEKPAKAPVTTARGPVMDARVRDNERVMFDDAALAAELFALTRAILPERLEEGVLVGYNERFRGYRYRGGQRFAPHFDGAFARNEHERSELTLLFYLNEGFCGGETRLLDWEVNIVPRRGSLLVFEHATYHEGARVTDGTKYVLRTDAMYRGTLSSL